jgi:SAM-dependent methyltransferase
VRTGGIPGAAWRLSQRGRRLWWRLADPRRVAEADGERVVFRHLLASGVLEPYRGGRILEIGPKHGEDSRLLASLDPAELVLLELPEKHDMVRTWLDDVSERAPTRLVEGNLLYLSPEALVGLGTFDLVWCLGVIYHNVEQLRLLRRLFHLTRPGGCLVLESSTTRNRVLARMNAVEIHWPERYRGQQTITHHPSRKALASWLEMVGYGSVSIREAYSRGTAWQRAVLTAVRPDQPSPYASYAATGDSWIAGDAT